jgi:hypothetical protein
VPRCLQVLARFGPVSPLFRHICYNGRALSRGCGVWPEDAHPRVRAAWDGARRLAQAPADATQAPAPRCHPRHRPHRRTSTGGKRRGAAQRWVRLDGSSVSPVLTRARRRWRQAGLGEAGRLFPKWQKRTKSPLVENFAMWKDGKFPRFAISRFFACFAKTPGGERFSWRDTAPRNSSTGRQAAGLSGLCQQEVC